MVRYILLAVCFAVGSCGSANEVTTASPYNKEQLRNLEIRAAGDDLVALRELELHYGFEGNMVEVKKIQQRRLSPSCGDRHMGESRCSRRTPLR